MNKDFKMATSRLLVKSDCLGLRRVSILGKKRSERSLPPQLGVYGPSFQSYPFPVETPVAPLYEEQWEQPVIARIILGFEGPLRFDDEGIASLLPVRAIDWRHFHLVGRCVRKRDGDLQCHRSI